MGLTLNSNSLTLEAAGGGGGAAGLSTADVNTLIESKSDYEFIKTLELTDVVSTWLITEGIDNDKYGGYKYVFESLRPYSGSLYRFRLKDENLSTFNVTGIAHHSNTSWAYITTSNTEIFHLYGSTQGLTHSSRMFMEVEITYNELQVQGFAKSAMAYPSGYWQHDARGSFVSHNNATFGGIELPDSYQSGTVKIYGRRKRSA